LIILLDKSVPAITSWLDWRNGYIPNSAI